MEEKYPGYIWNINEREVEFEPTESMEVTIETHDPELTTRDKKVRLYLISIVYLIKILFIQLCIFVSKIFRSDVDRLSRQSTIGDDIDRYPPRAFLEVKSSTFASSTVVLKGLKNCLFTVTSPHHQLHPAVLQHGNAMCMVLLKHAPCAYNLFRASLYYYTTNVDATGMS